MWAAELAQERFKLERKSRQPGVTKELMKDTQSQVTRNELLRAEAARFIMDHYRGENWHKKTKFSELSGWPRKGLWSDWSSENVRNEPGTLIMQRS